MFSERDRVRALELAACVCIFAGLVTLQSSPGRATISPIFIAGAVLAIYCVLEERRLRRALGAVETARTAVERARAWRPDRVTIAGITLFTLFIVGWFVILIFGLGS